MNPWIKTALIPVAIFGPAVVGYGVVYLDEAQAQRAIFPCASFTLAQSGALHRDARPLRHRSRMGVAAALRKSRRRGWSGNPSGGTVDAESARSGGDGHPRASRHAAADSRPARLAGPPKPKECGGLLTAFGILTLTGYGLYYAGGEKLRAWTSLIHLWLGLALPIIIALHVWLGHRSRRALRALRAEGLHLSTHPTNPHHAHP